MVGDVRCSGGVAYGFVAVDLGLEDLGGRIPSVRPSEKWPRTDTGAFDTWVLFGL